MAALLEQMTVSLIRQMYEDDHRISSYLCKEVKNIAVRIDNAFRYGHPERVFVW